MDNPRRCIYQDYRRSPASSLGGPKKPNSPENSRVVISCGSRGRSSVGSPRERACPGLLHHPPVLMCRRCLCPVTGMNQVCRGKGESPPMSYTDPGLHGSGTWHRSTMRNQPHPSAWKKGEMKQLKHLSRTTGYLSASLQLSQPQCMSFPGAQEGLLRFRGVGGHPGRPGWDLPCLVVLCRNTTFLQQRRMELEQMQPWGSVKWYLQRGCKAA